MQFRLNKMFKIKYRRYQVSPAWQLAGPAYQVAPTTFNIVEVHRRNPERSAQLKAQQQLYRKSLF